LPEASGTVNATTIYVRITSSAALGAISGNVANASAGATTENVAVTGTVTPVVTKPLPPVYVNPLQNLEGTVAGLTPFVFQVKLPKGNTTGGPVTYDVYTTDGTAKAGLNYVGITAGDTAHGGTVTFAAGQNIATVTVWVKAGSIPVTAATARETFNVNVSDPSNPTVPLDTGLGTILAQAIAPTPAAIATPAAVVAIVPAGSNVPQNSLNLTQPLSSAYVSTGSTQTTNVSTAALDEVFAALGTAKKTTI